MTAIQPMHDAPRCKCGEGLLVPVAYSDGMTRPEPRFGTTNDRQSDSHHNLLRCTGTGEEFYGWPLQVIRAWWSVGAHEQHVVDEPLIVSLKAQLQDAMTHLSDCKEANEFWKSECDDLLD